MKKSLFILFLLLFSLNYAFATKLKAYFTYCTFNSPVNGPYIETYLSVVGNSVIYKHNNNNKYQGTIEITYLFKQGNEIKKFKKYNLLSPESSDSVAIKQNFVDQQRISLPNGKYEFEIQIKDINSTSPPFKSNQILTINYQKDTISISDIELVESIKKSEKENILTKSGYDIFPYTSDFYPENFDNIAFYAEIYNADKLLGVGENYLIKYSIQSAESNKTIGNYSGFIREKAKAATVVLKSFAIKSLHSGNYYLIIEVRDQKNKLLISKKMFFQRSNPSVTPLLVVADYANTFVANMTVPQLEDYIKSVEPISTAMELNFARNQLKGKDKKLMQQYFYNFWLTRSQETPEKEWKDYLERVEIANNEFSTLIKRGYETDRGRIFLKYGRPNSLSEHKNEPSAYPYEIWHYYRVENFNNIKFVFYNPDGGAANDYPLLHSNLPSEINNPQWKVQLHRRTEQPTNINEEQNTEQWGDRSNDYYTNPR